MEFKGLICNNDNDYRAKERMIQNHLEKFTGYTSEFFAGGLGKPDLYSIEGKPILVQPKNQLWANEMPNLPLNFQLLDKEIINIEL